MGIGGEFYPGVQFSKDPEALNQFYRHMVPDTGPIDLEVNTNAVSTLFNKIGSGILVTHSHSGGQGWVTAIISNNSNYRGSITMTRGFIYIIYFRYFSTRDENHTPKQQVY